MRDAHRYSLVVTGISVLCLLIILLVSSLQTPQAHAAKSPPPLRATTFQALQGQRFTGVVAWIASAGLGYSIFWGDGTSSVLYVAQILSLNGSPVLSSLGPESGDCFFYNGASGKALVCSHTYAEPGTYTTMVGTMYGVPHSPHSIYDTYGRANVIPQVTPVTMSALAGRPFSGLLATFPDWPASFPIADVNSMSIDWGDGSSSTGTLKLIAGPKQIYQPVDSNPFTSRVTAGAVTLSGSHTYAATGTYTIFLVIEIPLPPSSLASAHINELCGTVNMSEAGPPVYGTNYLCAGGSSTITVRNTLSLAGQTIKTSFGTVPSKTIAKLTSVSPFSSSTVLQLSISWGDGTTSLWSWMVANSGYKRVDGLFVYTVSELMHAYASANVYVINITITQGAIVVSSYGMADVSSPPTS